MRLLENLSTKSGKIKNQIKQYKEKKDYLEHYVANCFYILIGSEKNVIDYKVISHKNLVVNHGFSRLFSFQ